MMQAIKNSSKPVTPPVSLKQNKTAGSPGAALAKSPLLAGMPSFQVRLVTEFQHSIMFDIVGMSWQANMPDLGSLFAG